MAGDDTGLKPEADWTPNFPLARRIDDLWVTGERWLCGGMFLVMSLLVFAAVMSSVFATRLEWHYAAILLLVVYGGCRTRVVKDGEQPLSQAVCIGASVAITAAICGATYWYVKAFPGGVTQAPALALCMMLWVALLGASITTYERAHLALEFGEKIWPKRYLHLVKGFARALTSLCCLFLLWLSYLAVTARYQLWEAGDRLADLVPGLENEGLPQWLVLVVIPYTFAAMAIRIAAQSYTAATRQAKPEQEQLPT